MPRVNGDIAGFRIRKSFDQQFTYSASTNQDIYLGSVLSGQYFKSNSGTFKAFSKFTAKQLSLVTGNAYEINGLKFRYDQKISSIADMNNVISTYLNGAKASLYGYSRYEHYPFTNYNQLSLFFGESSDIRKMSNIGQSEDLAKVENGLMYYNMKETIDLKFSPENKPLFESPYNAEEVKADEAGYVNKVTYGKISMITVDSKLAWRDMRALITKIRNQQDLTDQENEAIKTAKVYTFLKGFNTGEQNQLNTSTSALEKIKAFLAITHEPKASNGFSGGTFAYGDHGVPLFFEFTGASANKKFLKNFNYSKAIKFKKIYEKT